MNVEMRSHEERRLAGITHARKFRHIPRHLKVPKLTYGAPLTPLQVEVWYARLASAIAAKHIPHVVPAHIAEFRELLNKRNHPSCWRKPK